MGHTRSPGGKGTGRLRSPMMNPTRIIAYRPTSRLPTGMPLRPHGPRCLRPPRLWKIQCLLPRRRRKSRWLRRVLRRCVLRWHQVHCVRRPWVSLERVCLLLRLPRRRPQRHRRPRLLRHSLSNEPRLLFRLRPRRKPQRRLSLRLLRLLLQPNPRLPRSPRARVSSRRARKLLELRSHHSPDPGSAPCCRLGTCRYLRRNRAKWFLGRASLCRLR